jgi:uncharacterized protein
VKKSQIYPLFNPIKEYHMLVQFSVGNFLSVREIVTLSMVAAKIKSKDSVLDAQNVFKVNEKLSLLKSAAIYGANASGKSNIIAAMRFMRWFVANSFKESNITAPIEVDEFRLSTETLSKPSFFEVVFLIEGIQYRYGFEADKEQVVSEWLFFVPTTKEVKLFDRTVDSIQLGKRFKEGRGLKEKTRKNVLFLSVVAQFNGSIAQKVLNWFKELGIISGLTDRGYMPYTIKSYYSGEKQDEILQLIQRLDLGIDDIQIEKGPLPTLPPDMPEELKGLAEELQKLVAQQGGEIEAFKVHVAHRRYNTEGEPVSVEHFDLAKHESQGTQKLFALAGPLIDVLTGGAPLIVDELDARLHPLITCEIIKLFNSEEANPHNAQLIFTTHDTNLLSNKLLRRDQIWFTEKDRYGATDLYSLVEYKGIRNDASFEKDYVQGRYGAIPFLGNVSRLFGDHNA